MIKKKVQTEADWQICNVFIHLKSKRAAALYIFTWLRLWWKGIWKFSVFRVTEGLKVGLSVERSGERFVVESPGYAVATLVGSHASDAVLGLIGRQFTTEHVRGYVRL